jgi:hypothetical protein
LRKKEDGDRDREGGREKRELLKKGEREEMKEKGKCRREEKRDTVYIMTKYELL